MAIELENIDLITHLEAVKYGATAKSYEGDAYLRRHKLAYRNSKGWLNLTKKGREKLLQLSRRQVLGKDEEGGTKNGNS